MAVLCQLANPTNYIVSAWNLADDPDTSAYWLNLFATFPDRFEKPLCEDGIAGDHFETRWRTFRSEYDEGMRAIKADADNRMDLRTIDLCRFRQKMLNKHGFHDPYLNVKTRENKIAAAIYPKVIKRIDRTDPDNRWDLLLRGMLAGNMFDLGCPETIDMYNNGQLDFFKTFEQIPDRPWFVDDADAFIGRLQNGVRWKQVLFFVDNAGTDIVLGVIPVAREMARAGIRVVLAAQQCTGPERYHHR